MNLSLINDESTEFADAVKQKSSSLTKPNGKGLAVRISASNYKTLKANC